MLVKPMDEWPLWQRVVFVNGIAAVGAYVGIASSEVRPSVNLEVYSVVFVALLMNLMFLAVRPRLQSQRRAGRTPPSVWRVLYEVLAGRPYITALLVIQLVGASRCFGTTITIMQLSTGSYVRRLPNAPAVSLRLMGDSALMGAVAVLWLLSAVGIWLGRLWAWWLALVLDGLAAGTGAILQLFSPHEFLLDPLAAVAVVLLLLRPVRAGFRVSKTSVRETASACTIDNQP